MRWGRSSVPAKEKTLLVADCEELYFLFERDHTSALFVAVVVVDGTNALTGSFVEHLVSFNKDDWRKMANA